METSIFSNNLFFFQKFSFPYFNNFSFNKYLIYHPFKIFLKKILENSYQIFFLFIFNIFLK